ncbi:MAG: flagellin lysine-N-methylase [Oscillospiraceae bacterium]|nr:flagellin lysine-N-methylase [Oscillospiraceae bacterium]
MLQVFPDYYKDFHCIAGECRHNCCIGWEIDVDEETLAFYDTVDGELGERMRRCIDRGDTPRFALGADERCPFLNEENLCDIITELGQKHLCQICADHPRFRCELPGRIETGLGLCCEAAGRLILGKYDPLRLVIVGDGGEEDETIALRDEILALLARREQPLAKRMGEALRLCGGGESEKTMQEWAEFLLTLERLEEDWTDILSALTKKTPDFAAFDAVMRGRETEYEQFFAYLIYRHLANAADEVDLAARCSFAVLGTELLYALGALHYERTGTFTFDDQVELARRISAEIEYSDDNLEAVLDELAFA